MLKNLGHRFRWLGFGIGLLVGLGPIFLEGLNAQKTGSGGVKTPDSKPQTPWNPESEDFYYFQIPWPKDKPIDKRDILITSLMIALGYNRAAAEQAN